MTSRRKGDGFISSWRPEHPRFTGCDEINQSPILLGRPITSAAPNSHQMARLCRRSIKRRQIHGQSEVCRQARDGALYLHHHAPDVAAMDLFVVPTIGFKLLYAFVIVRLDRSDLVWINVTVSPTAEGIARASGLKHSLGDGAPKYLIRDRDRIYDAVVTRRLRAMGIRDKLTAPARALAEGRCRTTDRIDLARVFPSRHHPGRSTFASDSAIVRNVLQ
jgi:hypothetical protein